MMTITSEQQATFLDKRDLLVPRILQEDEHMHQKKPCTESTPVPQEKEPQTESILLTAEVHTSSFQPTPYDPSTSDKGKSPAIESSDADDEETEDELDPAQFCLARRKPGSSKITILAL